MNWILNILGANSAVPTRNRFPSGQVLDLGGTSLLIDCGEGSQLRMLEQRIKKTRISYVLISHLHGDHIYGLPGLLTSYNLFSRTLPLCIVGPVGIKRFVDNTIGITGHELSYPVEIIEIDGTTKELVLDKDTFKVYSFPLEHRIPTYGYQIVEKMNRVYLDKEKIAKYKLTDSKIKSLLDGETIKVNGVNWDLSFFERTRTPISYSYVSDTKYFSQCGEYIEKSTALYHESTFLEKDKALATERYHSTAKEAATCAMNGQVGGLILGHFSSRYKTLESFRSEAEVIFKDVFLASNGKSFLIFDDGRISEV
ncbi:ribonuclease Z [Membranihabitans maritimus]|uniref:ribonuclease Z n=1 Tax=Membranihabitans maritimus TaxID=2904244 RepID=UPI001F00D2B3|nr:ribonuclease Z [Membranihabitans maritimus]